VSFFRNLRWLALCALAGLPLSASAQIDPPQAVATVTATIDTDVPTGALEHWE